MKTIELTEDATVVLLDIIAEYSARPEGEFSFAAEDAVLEHVADLLVELHDGGELIVSDKEFSEIQQVVECVVDGLGLCCHEEGSDDLIDAFASVESIR